MGILELLFRRKSETQTVTRSEVVFTKFEVANVTLATTALRTVPCPDAIEALLQNPRSRSSGNSGRTVAPTITTIEACSRHREQLVRGVNFHPLVAAIHLAFNDHRPLVLSPDMLWLLVAQGLANHINANAEELRPMFVAHAGKAPIVVRRDDFKKGAPGNPWPEVFSEFSRYIRDHIGAATHDLLLPTFSTTGAVERAATEVVLLDAMQSYFSFDLRTLCGIPQFVLEGTADDWAALAERTRSIGQFGLTWWTDALEPILSEFVAASHGQPNVGFWQSIYKRDNESGGPYANGWITAFFPYLKDEKTGHVSRKNPWLAQGGEALKELLFPSKSRDPARFGHGLTTDTLPSGLVRAPFVWKHYFSSYEMEFLGGFVGVRQDADTLRLRPEIGWAVGKIGVV